MSEKLLKSTLRLFALLAVTDGVEEDERQRIRYFLNSRLNVETASSYFILFEQYLQEYQGLTQDRCLDVIGDICRTINTELTVLQKTYLTLELLQLVYADQFISAGEEEAVELIRRSLHISPADLAAIRLFVTASVREDFEHPDILIVQSAESGIHMRSKGLIVEQLNGFAAVLHLSSIKPFFVRYLGNTELLLNHVVLQYGNIETFAPGSTLRWAGETLYYSDILHAFMQEDSNIRLTFRAEAISYRFTDGAYGLRDVTVTGREGQMVGVMGASGSGKSMLFDVLNGSERPTSGSVFINGVDIHNQSEQVEGLIGFVPQDDLLIEDLTVYENMYYAAKLCFDGYSRDQLQSVVEETLSSLGLDSVKDLPVGSPLRKTISGGQRKRLNIGLELLREPMVLFVDEPTSGLSSRDSDNIMDLLKELSLKGKLIFVIIHQPSSGIFKMFDNLLVMDIGGYPIYFGNPLDAVRYFREAVQWIERHQGACPECGNINPEQIFDIVENKVVDEYGKETSHRKITPQTWHQIYKERISISTHEIEIPEGVEKPDSFVQIPGRIRQALIFMERDVRSKLNNRQYLALNFLEAPLLAVILAVLVRYHAEDLLRPGEYIFQENMNIPAYFFMGVVVALFMGLTVSAEEIIKDRRILKREAFLHLSQGSYIASKVALMLFLSAFQTLSFVVIGNAILEVQGMTGAFWAVLFSVSFFANMLGLNISATLNSVVTIYILIPILLIPQILLSGVVVQFDQLNPAFGAKSRVPVIGDIMVSRWAYEALMVRQFKDNAFNRKFYPLDKRIANDEYMTVYYVPHLQSMLDYVFVNQHDREDDIAGLVSKHRKVLHNEFRMRLEEVGFDKWPRYDDFTRHPIDSSLYSDAKRLLSTLNRMYISRLQEARMEREAMVQDIVNTPGGFDRYQRMMQVHTNNQVASVVKDNLETVRIQEHKGRLIRRIYPVYDDPHPRHLLDFGAPFYAPRKHFAGMYFDTLYFNIAVIWVMSAALIVLLYFDVLRTLTSRRRTIR
jgi:ABC-type multidrug transport system ATPase subunit